MVTAWFNKMVTLTPATAPEDQSFVGRSLIVPILEAPSTKELVIEEFVSYVALQSIAEAPVIADNPLLSEAEKDALYYATLISQAETKALQCWIWIESDYQWHILTEWLMVRRYPEYRDDLLTRITTKDTLILARGNRLGLSVAETNTGLLAGADSVRIWANYFTEDLAA